MVGVTKLRIKFGPEGSVKTFQTFPDSNVKKIEQPIIGGDVVVKPANLSKKRGATELEEVQAKKKIKLDHDLSTQCLRLLRLLRDHEFGWLFGEPVDPVRLMIPDYFSVVSKPMDLGTIKSKLLKSGYSNADEFAADVRLTFNNAMLYNPPDNSVHKVAKELMESFEVRWESLKKKKVSKLSGSEVKEVDCSRQSSSETSASSGRFSVELMKPVKEKSGKVSLLLKPVKGQIKKDTPVVAPKALVTKLTIKKLDQGFGVSSTLKTPSKGSAPTTSFKCGSCGRVTCICLKPCNSTGSEVSSLTDCQLTNTSGPQASESDPHSNGSVNSKNDKNGCVSSQLDKPSNSATKVKTTFPAMPPLPPEKALRAAIVKAQFAETILRAKHRKVLDQSKKVDLIQIQIEKEQMERTQREEKARIEAEMKAAQIATRMRKETELKQRRERERLEIQKMKITYDFEENNFLRLEKDLIRLCGHANPTRSRLIELGLFLRNDDRMEEIDLEFSDAMRVDDLEEGEIF